jgi:hypothetical protein
MDAGTRQRLRAGLERSADRLAVLEERFDRLERALFGGEVDDLAERVARLEEQAWLPTSQTLGYRRREAIHKLRGEGQSIAMIAEAVGMSRSRVAALARELPTPERVTAVTGRSYPAAAMAEHRRLNGGGADRTGGRRPRPFVDTTWTARPQA